VFAYAFAERLLPAREVSVLPTVLLADIEAKPDNLVAASADAETSAEPSPDYSAPMLFQAAGWFEPDPLPIRATALVDGVVDEVAVLEGETVEKGQLLATLIAADTELDLARTERKLEQTVAEHHMHLANIPAVKAEAASVLQQIKAAEAQLEELADRRSRLEQLSAGTVSEQELTAARLAVDSQAAKIASLKSDHVAVLARLEAITTQSKVFDAMIAAAKVEVDERKLAHSRTRISSPVDGVVLELHSAPGEKKLLRMDNLDSATIAVLFETGKLQARVDVPLADARQLAPGQLAIVTSDFLPNAEFKGVVSRIVGTADLQRNTLQAKVRVIDPDPRLRPEMLCRVKFLGTQAPASLASSSDSSTSPSAPPRDGDGARAVMAPTECLFDREGNVATAWVASTSGRRAQRRIVELGSLQLEGYIAVRSGLLAGELLIRPPHDDLDEGRRIKIDSTRP
jgi:multidrug efflux pump subunit AcrA (membrane-fusion protein)